MFIQDYIDVTDFVKIGGKNGLAIKRVNFKHFAGSAVIVQRTGSKTTVEDCVSTCLLYTSRCV